jgi:hypothetical protein
MAISHLEHFNDSSRVALWQAAQAADPHFRQYWQMSKFQNCARHAYSLDSCKAPGLDFIDISECGEDDFFFTGAFIDYRPGHIDAYIAHLTTYGMSISGQVHLNGSMINTGPSVSFCFQVRQKLLLMTSSFSRDCQERSKSTTLRLNKP